MSAGILPFASGRNSSAASLPPRAPSRREARWRDPALIFLFAGALIFAVYWLLTREEETITVTLAQQEALAGDFRTLQGRAPNKAEMDKLVADHVANETLFREALKRGIHLSDPAIRQRMIENIRFSLSGAMVEPTEADLIEYYAKNRSTYQFEPALTFEQVFFTKMPQDAGDVSARLNAGMVVQSDSFWLGRKLENYGESMVRGTFGGDFLEEVRKHEPGRWFGPVQSVRGFHFVRVLERKPARAMPFPEASEQVKQDWFSNHVKSAVDAEAERLKKDYDVVIEK